ncbi:MAG: MDR/zinc-dependent alcohol dehydrogenase-like family protein [Pyrinomonadaceae bacterium]
MQALRFQKGKLDIFDVKLQNAASDSVIRVLLSGICSTDIEITRGYSGFEGTLGHEFVGIVENSPDRPDLSGKRVVGEINVGCGDCQLCQKGDARHCPKRTVLGIKGRDGSHAEFVSLPSRNLLEIPPDLSDEEAVFIEPLAAALGIIERIDLKNAEKIAIIGDGKLGLLCAFALNRVCPSLTLYGRYSSKLKIAEAAGIETCLVDETTHQYSFYDVVVEATGSESGFAMALDLVRPRGTIVLKSTYSGKAEIEAWRIVVDEISIVGSRCGRFKPTIEWLVNNRIDLAQLISDEFPLSKGLAAFDTAKQPGVLKVLLRNT